MEQTLNETPRSERIHIGFYGKRNAGKSSLVNALANQTVSVVSAIEGTTTDTVEKAMELLPIGSVVLIDTPGLDDSGTLGELRMVQAKRAFTHTDIAVLVIDASKGLTKEDISIQSLLKKNQIPTLVVWNKWDLSSYDSVPDHAIAVSTITGEGIAVLKNKLGNLFQTSIQPQKTNTIFGNAIQKEDIIILVTPIDESAPKGRMILPQVQSIRDILDKQAVCFVTQPQQLSHVLAALRHPPKLVVTDSQAFAQVKDLISEDIFLTSFSILFARYKGVLKQSYNCIMQFEKLPENSTILIAEGCTHHRQCHDIGTVKLPKWITVHTGKQFHFEFTSGNNFPEDLSPYQMIIHCGGCMLNQREMESRADRAKSQGIPQTNYGILIAYLNGILERSLKFLRQIGF